MNSLHLHLLINHLPVAGTLLGVLLLVLALWRRNAHTEVAAYFLFVVSSVGAVITYLTGEGAEEAVEHIREISKDAIEKHEEFSIYPLVALIFLGVAAIIGIILRRRRSRFAKKMSFILLILSVISFILVAWTGYLGGQIRHTELQHSTFTPSKSYQDQSLKKLP
jgi:uncharacterized membrane protein